MEWCNQPIVTRAPEGGFTDPLNGQRYAAGEFTPFYVPRPIMPQVEEADYLALLAFAADSGADVTVKKVDPAGLKAHQRIDPIHAERMPEDVRRKPILVSRDGYVLDGNHRWMLHRKLSEAILVFEIALPFEQAISLLFEFPNTYDLADRPEAN